MFTLSSYITPFKQYTDGGERVHRSLCQSVFYLCERTSFPVAHSFLSRFTSWSSSSLFFFSSHLLLFLLVTWWTDLGLPEPQAVELHYVNGHMVVRGHFLRVHQSFEVGVQLQPPAFVWGGVHVHVSGHTCDCLKPVMQHSRQLNVVSACVRTCGASLISSFL